MPNCCAASSATPPTSRSIDKDGNIFDSTPSGALDPTAVVLGETGIPMSVRGEAFRLDKTRAQQYRPRSRPRYTLAPTIVLRDGQPFMALGSPGGDNQAQTILQAFLDVVEFRSEWYPNLHTAFEWPRMQTLHLFGSPYPYLLRLQQAQSRGRHSGRGGERAEGARPRGVAHPREQHRELRDRGADRRGTGNRIAGADPRRDCYAMAY